MRVNLADVVTPAEVKRPGFTDAAFGLGALWLVNQKTNFIATLDPATNAALLPPGPQGPGGFFANGGPEAIAVTRKTLWIPRFAHDSIIWLTFPRGPRFFPSPHSPIEVGDGPVDIAVGEGGVWVLNRLDASVSRIDEETGEVVATIDVGNEPQHIAVGEGYVWVTVRAPDEDETVESDATGP
jgi:YVTN family beta-propeller protein